MQLKNIWCGPIILFLIALGVWFRATAYGSLQLSIGMPDTPSYIKSGNSPLFSWEIFSARRLFTVNLLYKLDSGNGCITNPEISTPAIGIETKRRIYKCLNKIALLQNWISIFGWSLLALILSRWLRTPIYSLLLVTLVLAFGFTPQIAEWDSILSSESLSLSLFALSFAVLVEIVFRITHRENLPEQEKINSILPISWLIIFTLWCFVRDVHLYAIITTFAVTLPLFYFAKIRQLTILYSVLIFLCIIFIVGIKTSQISQRWPLAIQHAMDVYILPYPDRVIFFRNLGMPNVGSSTDYQKWLNSHGNRDYGLFLISHPGFVLSTYLQFHEYFSSDFLQPYFTTRKFASRNNLIAMGEFIHPETNAVYLISFLLLISLIWSSIAHKDRRTISWTWLAIWIFLYAGISLTLSFLGDADGTRRHIYPSVEIFRLSDWIFLVALMDIKS